MFRSTAKQDANRIVEILNQAISERRNAYLRPFDAEQGREWFDRIDKQSYVFDVFCDENGGVDAWGTLSSYRGGRGALAHVAEVTFYVERSARGKGLGGSMISHLESRARSKGFQTLVAILLDDNLPSRNLLDRLGYKEWANFKGLAHFPDGDRGHLYMGKNLTD